MKIILGSESFPPNISGVATATFNLAENLAKAGHSVYVFTPGPVYSAKVDRKFTDFTVIRFKSIINPFRKGYRVTFVSSKIIDFEVAKIKPDLIHLQDPANIGRLLRDAGNKMGIPVVITNHFSLEYALSYIKFFKLANSLLREALIKYLVNFYDQCDQIVTPTETFRKQIEEWGVKTPVCAVSNGIEVEDFLEKPSREELERTREIFHLPENPIVLYLGRVDKDKSIDVLVRAIPLILKKINAHFVIAGSGGEVENLGKLIANLGVDEDVTMIGFVDHDSPNFVRLYKCSSIFAIPSTIETQSIVTLEALSSGIPVVAADAGALPELVVNNKDGFLFKPGDEKALARRIITILSDKKLAKKMSANAVHMAMNHQMKKAFAEMLKLYKEVIERKKQRQNNEF